MKLGQRSGAALGHGDFGPVGPGAARTSASRSPICARSCRSGSTRWRCGSGQVNAHVIRLDALGKRLTDMANIDPREFDFDSEPPTGGPEDSDGVGAEIPDLTGLLDSLERKVDLRDAAARRPRERHPLPRPHPADPPRRQADQVGLHFLVFRRAPGPVHAATRPSTAAWTSPARRALRSSAVATGVVTWAGARSGYGSLIEINHGNGYVTRYGHNQRVLVAVGQTVTRGQPVALMGSTGRSTGPSRPLRSVEERPADQPGDRSWALRATLNSIVKVGSANVGFGGETE